MRRQIWMGLRGQERWVPAPAINMPRSRVGYTESVGYISGGVGVKRSKATHGVWDMTWPNKHIAEVAFIQALAAGVYDVNDGANPVYFIDPFAALSNVLPPDLAAPGSSSDLVPLIRGAAWSRVAASASGSYPRRSASYAVTGVPRKTYIPIPPDSVLHIGAHGSVSGTGRVRVTPFIGDAAAAPVDLTMLSRGETLTNATFAGSSFTGVEIALFGVTTGAGSVTLNAMLGQILPAGASAPSGPWLPGRGHGGCSFEDVPGESALSAALDRVSFSARLVETQTWL